MTADNAFRKHLPFWRKVHIGDGCWEWRGCTSSGYGNIRAWGRKWYTHTFAYMALVGPVPPGLQLDHLCRNRRCVRPSHLEPVTSAENSRRGLLYPLLRERARARTHCRRGHELTDLNTYAYGSRRRCRKCAALTAAAYRERKQEAA